MTNEGTRQDNHWGALIGVFGVVAAIGWLGYQEWGPNPPLWTKHAAETAMREHLGVNAQLATFPEMHYAPLSRDFICGKVKLGHVGPLDFIYSGGSALLVDKNDPNIASLFSLTCLGKPEDVTG